MPDMLVNLLRLPPLQPELDRMAELGVLIRRVLPHELAKVQPWIAERFGDGWAAEVTPGFCNKPTTVYIALRQGRLVGFAGVECTHKAFFGPTGVDESERGQGIGKALLIASLHGLRELGYAYGIIGGAGPTGFYAQCVGAVVIEGSVPGIYADGISGD